MRMIKQSWSMVTAWTIANCYRHCGFPELLSNVTNDESKDDNNIPLSQLVRLRNVDMGAYVSVDNNLLTCSKLTDSDIIDDLLIVRNPVSEANANGDDSDDDAAEELPLLAAAQAMEACDVMQRFFETISENDNVLNVFSVLDKELLRCDMRKRCGKQTLIRDFFKK